MSASASPSATLHASANLMSATRNVRSSAMESMRAVSDIGLPLFQVLFDQVGLLGEERHVLRRFLEERAERLDRVLELLLELLLLLVAPGVLEVAHARVQAGHE